MLIAQMIKEYVADSRPELEAWYYEFSEVILIQQTSRWYQPPYIFIHLAFGEISFHTVDKIVYRLYYTEHTILQQLSRIINEL